MRLLKTIQYPKQKITIEIYTDKNGYLVTDGFGQVGFTQHDLNMFNNDITECALQSLDHHYDNCYSEC